MNKIYKVSHFLQRLFLVLLIAMPIVLSYMCLFHLETLFKLGCFREMPDLTQMPNIANFIANFSFLRRFVVLLALFIPTSLTLMLLYYLSKLFKLFKEGQLFGVENVGLIKRIGIIMILSECISPIYQVAISLALTLFNPLEKSLITIGFGSTNVTNIITGLIILLAAWIVEEGRKIQYEQQLTI